jgi:hypothetical protein
MQPFDVEERDDGDVVFRDLIMLMLSGFVTITVLMLAHINAPGAKTMTGSEPPGNVMVEMRWGDQLDADVDLWVQAPGDVPVGYSNKGGKFFNLLRDDLGTRGDATGLNYEVSYSRGIPVGESTVNVHLYRNNSSEAAIPVTIVTSVKKSSGESAKQILATKVVLGHEGEEVTAYRFTLDDKGALQQGSVHSLFKPLRSARTS